MKKRLKANETVDLAEALRILRTALNTNSDYYNSWQANLAMAFQDAWQWAAETPMGKSAPELLSAPEFRHDIANRAAIRFLELLCSKETNL